MRKLVLIGLFIGLTFAQQREQSNSADYQLKELMVMCQALEQLELKYEHKMDSLIREGLSKEVELTEIELLYFGKKKALLQELLDLKVSIIGKLEDAMARPE